MKIRRKYVEALFGWTSDKGVSMFSPPPSFVITDLCFELCASKSLDAFWIRPLLNTNVLQINLFPYHNIGRLTMVGISVQQWTPTYFRITNLVDSGTIFDTRSLQLQFGLIHSITHNDRFDFLVQNSKLPFIAISESFLFRSFLVLKYFPSCKSDPSLKVESDAKLLAHWLAHC